jgi:hypothetical protein
MLKNLFEQGGYPIGRQYIKNWILCAAQPRAISNFWITLIEFRAFQQMLKVGLQRYLPQTSHHYHDPEHR